MKNTNKEEKKKFIFNDEVDWFDLMFIWWFLFFLRFQCFQKLLNGYFRLNKNICKKKQL